MLASQSTQLIIQIASTVVLARVLDPADFGLVAMVTAVIAFGNAFRELGLGTATIQKAEISDDHVSALFWINVTVGMTLTLIMMAAAPVVAWAFREPALIPLMIFLSAGIAIGSMGTQHLALMHRKMQFVHAEIVKVAGMLLAAIAAIISALLGAGYWALAVNNLTVAGLTVGGFWIVCKWIPHRPRKVKGLMHSIRFGMHVTGFDIINYFSRNLDRILIGRFFGAGELGLYSKAYTLMMLPISNLRVPLNTVGLPAMSRIQNEPERFRSYYIKYTSLLAFISMPIVAFMFVFSDEIIRIVLGSKWEQAGGLFRILAAAAFIQPVASQTGLVLMSSGESKRYLHLGVLYAVGLSVAFVVGIPWGPKGVALSYAVANYLLLFPALSFAFRTSVVRPLDFVGSVYRPATASLFAGLCSWQFVRIIGWDQVVVSLMGGFFAYCVGYMLSWLILPGGRRYLMQYLSYLYPKASKHGVDSNGD